MLEKARRYMGTAMSASSWTGATSARVTSTTWTIADTTSSSRSRAWPLRSAP
jgi:hypothetical protein